LIGMMLAAKSSSPIRRLVLNDVGPLISWSALVRLKLTSTGAVAPQEVSLAKRVLDAAALTYVAAAAVAALQLLRMVLLRNSRN